MSAPFTRAKPSKLERKLMKERRKGNMANSFPAHIEGALSADAKWKKRGGVRKRLHQNRGTQQKKKRKTGATRGSGARAAAAVRCVWRVVVVVVFRWYLTFFFVLCFFSFWGPSISLPCVQLHQNRNHRGPNVSKTGAFEGMNPTIDNPTPEYRAVVFATKELKPMSIKQFEYKSELRQQPRRGAPVLPEDLDATTQLA
jgi:hypothetical protein